MQQSPASRVNIPAPIPVVQDPADQPGYSHDKVDKTAPGREGRLFPILAIFIGIFSGILVVCFRISIEWCSLALLGSPKRPHDPRLMLTPMVVGLIVAVLLYKVFPTARGSGVTQTKAALYIYNGYISFRTVIGKFILSALAIGSGQSLGPEDPSLQIGAGVASLLGRRLQLSRDRLRLIAPIGAAAGLAAAFNAPISAVLFVIEEVIGRWNAGVLGAVVLSSIASVVVSRWFLGSEPMFRVPSIQLRDPRELLAYAVLGIAGGFASWLMVKAIVSLRAALHKIPVWNRYFQSAAAGLLVGLIGFVGFPQVMGAGYEVMDHAMHGEFGWKLLLVLALLKIVATTVSFSSGTPGGMFAPTLFIGAMLGGAVGGFEHIYFSHWTGPIGSYALVGMGVLFAGFLRVPLTSVFMVLEVSGNYSIIVPVILANTIAYLIGRTLQPVPIFEVLTRQDGLDLPSMEEQREEVRLHVEDAMQTVDVAMVQATQTLAEALASSESFRGQKIGKEMLLVHWSSYRWGLTEVKRLIEIADQHGSDTKLGAVLDAEILPQIFPDMPLEVGIGPLQHHPLLPVLHRADPERLEGILRMDGVMKAYRERSG